MKAGYGGVKPLTRQYLPSVVSNRELLPYKSYEIVNLLLDVVNI